MAEQPTPSFKVVIPARFASTRLPGKPLRKLAGVTMIEHVWRRAVESGAQQIWVATDDDRIVDAVGTFGGNAELTSVDHASGTDRLAEVAARLGWPDDDIVVNLQGDEPCMEPSAIALVAAELAAKPKVGVATLATPISEPATLFDPNVVKVVLTDAGLASYFSRAPIPWPRDAVAAGFDAAARELPSGVPFLRHLGLYAYRVSTLHELVATAPSPCERAESLEQLRALALGISIAVGIVDEAPGQGVDTAADLAAAEAQLLQGRLS